MNTIEILLGIIHDRNDEIAQLRRTMKGKDSLVRQLTDEMVHQRDRADELAPDLRGAREALKLRKASSDTKVVPHRSETKRYAVSGVKEIEGEEQEI